MANTTIKLPRLEWTLLTGSDVSELAIQNVGQGVIYIAAAVGETPPTSLDGAAKLHGGTLNPSKLTLADVFPGVSGANRLYAYALASQAAVMVSHS